MKNEEEEEEIAILLPARVIAGQIGRSIPSDVVIRREMRSTKLQRKSEADLIRHLACIQTTIEQALLHEKRLPQEVEVLRLKEMRYTEMLLERKYRATWRTVLQTIIWYT